MKDRRNVHPYEICLNLEDSNWKVAGLNPSAGEDFSNISPLKLTCCLPVSIIRSEIKAQESSECHKTVLLD